MFSFFVLSYYYLLIAKLWVITAPSLLVMFMATFGIWSSVPPTPPTSSAEEKSEPFFDGLKQVSSPSSVTLNSLPHNPNF